MAEWIRSSFCSDSGCLEVRFDSHGDAWIRDADTDQGMLYAPKADWAAFIAGVRNNEFDLPEDTV